MKSMTFALALMLSSVPALAKDITITLNDDEQRVLIQMLDQANKAGGLQNAEAAIFFVKKIQTAGQPQPQSQQAAPPKE